MDAHFSQLFARSFGVALASSGDTLLPMLDHSSSMLD
jgi:hypothetical protein